MTVAEGWGYLPAKSAKAALQWGRNLTVAEGLQAERKRTHALASMGPQLDSCGRRNPMTDADLDHRLQWGRNLTVAEGANMAVSIAPWVKLQWGRNLTVAEGRVTDDLGIYREMLQWGRNLTVAEGSSRRCCPCRPD